MVKYVPTYTQGTLKKKKKKRSAKDLSTDAYATFLLFFFFPDFLFKSICCGYSFELLQQSNAIQMGTHNICLYKEVDKRTLALI